MILDGTGVALTPGAMGKECRGNGCTMDADGNLIECCCDECDYMQCCLETHRIEVCIVCQDQHCPRSSACAEYAGTI